MLGYISNPNILSHRVKGLIWVNHNLTFVQNKQLTTCRVRSSADARPPMTSPLKFSLGRFAPTPGIMRHCGTVADAATAALSQLIGRSALIIWLSTMIG